LSKVCILIPAYNESAQIGQLVRSLRSKGHVPVVVDDGSQDNTAEEARSAGADVITHERNMGKGVSLKTGIEYILKEGYDAVLIMDGDAQHSADDIQKFVVLADKRHDTFIIGNRMDDTKNMPIERKLTNKFMSYIVSRICGQNIPDSQCGFRLIKRKLLEKIDIESERFEVESELLIKASRAGADIISVPIETFYGEEESKINPFRDTFRFVIFLLKLPFMK